LEQVLTNLLANATKFTEHGGIVVETRVVGEAPPGFTVLGTTEHAPRSDAVAILVTDTGVGVREHDLRQLASDFHQLDGAAERFGGTGLGLSISRRLVDLLGGRLVVRSRHGVGSTFGILLRCPAPAPSLEAAPATQRGRAWMTLKAAASSSS
ncbi:MAG: ATP-binding protein, partial [Candidatus Binatia bacterium]